ncbi:MAG TPA: TIGR03085 family metal-binding protein [Actinomycetes bacterium]|nr:TIGR03085 family metal-binding protein [Actinomycetes bacterium]
MPPSKPPPDQLLVRRERLAVCETLETVGPDVPTLCGDWDARQLAAHLVLREGHPAAVGVGIGPLHGWTEHTQNNLARSPFSQLVRRLRSGPPWWSPLGWSTLDAAFNTFEYFVHHEDVRRAATRWSPRPLSQADQAELWRLLAGRAKIFVRRSPVTVHLVPTGLPAAVQRERLTLQPGRLANGQVTLTGTPGELGLYLHGRRAHAVVEVTGTDSAVSKFESIDLSV